MAPNLPTLIAQFCTSEAGAAGTNRVFMIATACTLAIGLAAFVVLDDGANDRVEATPQELAEQAFRAANGGHDRVTVLINGQRDFFTADAMQARYEALRNANLTTENEVRDAHRTWSRRVADPAYSQPDRATDMVRILDAVLAARALEPHRGF